MLTFSCDACNSPVGCREAYWKKNALPATVLHCDERSAKERRSLMLIQYLEAWPTGTELNEWFVRSLLLSPSLKLQADHKSKSVKKNNVIDHDLSFCSLIGLLEIFLEAIQVNGRNSRTSCEKRLKWSGIASEGSDQHWT